MSADAKTELMPSRKEGQLKPGTRLNNIYEIESLVAVGGMGEVYRGRTVQTGDSVALKILRAEFANNEAAMGLFRKEASTLHRFAHDAIIRYYLFSYDEEIGHAYLAMEFVDGPPLSDALKSGPMPVKDVDILRVRLATALHEAHKFGVVHRDLSPDNVILPNNDVRRSKIIDFGIVRSLDPADKTLIGSGFAGKYNYVSPEQLGLYGGVVGPQSDIYSLGLLLACALRGKPLDMEGTSVEIVEKRRTVPDLSSVNAHFRPLLGMMLEPDPARRIKTMKEVADWKLPVAAQRGPFLGFGGTRSAARAEAPKRSGGFGGHAAVLAGLGVVAAGLGTGVALFVLSDSSISEIDKLPDRSGNQTVTPGPVLDGDGEDEPAGTQAGGSGSPAVDDTDTTIARPGTTGTVDGSGADGDIGPSDAGSRPVLAASPAARIEAAELPDDPRITAMLDFVDRANRTSCFYAAIDEISRDSLTVRLFGKDAEELRPFYERFDRQFDFTPTAIGHIVTEDQCPALDFLRQGSSTSPIDIKLRDDQLQPGEVLSATTMHNGGRAARYILVTDDGQVFSLDEYTSGDGTEITVPIDREVTAGEAPSILISISAKYGSVTLPQLEGPMPANRYFDELSQMLRAPGPMVALKPGYFVFLP